MALSPAMPEERLSSPACPSAQPAEGPAGSLCCAKQFADGEVRICRSSLYCCIFVDI